MEVPKVSSVQPLGNKKLLVKFDNGVEKIYDCGQLFNLENFQLLKNETFFKAVKVGIGDYGISWNDDVDLSNDELWKNGVETEKTTVMVVQEFMPLDLSQASKEEIYRKVPSFSKELNWLVILDQEWLDHLGGPKSSLPIARVCLHDAVRVASQAGYALEQAYAHIIWFRKECTDAPKEPEAHYYGRFYADDAALRLYSATEHTASFIEALRNIPKERQKGNKYVAKAVVIGKYLKEQRPKDPITGIVSCLMSDEWNFVRDYRNQWVHNKPPVLDSPGLDYRRRNRWNKVGEMWMVAHGITQTPDYTLDDLLEKMSKATWDFQTALSKLTDLFFQELETLGIKRDVGAGILAPPNDYSKRVPGGIFEDKQPNK